MQLQTIEPPSHPFGRLAHLRVTHFAPPRFASVFATSRLRGSSLLFVARAKRGNAGFSQIPLRFNHCAAGDIVAGVTRGSRIALLTLFSAAAFLASLGSRDIATSHEARVAETAREMAVTGWPWSAQKASAPPVALTSVRGMVRLSPDLHAEPIAVNTWAVPLLNGEIRLQKPPLPYWCAAMLFRLFGFSEATARLMPALLGALATIFVYDFARLLMGRWKARLAALIWISTLFIPEEFRKAMADPYLAFCTLVCVWAWVKAAAIQREQRHRQTIFGAASLCVIIFYVSLALGILAKGPPLFLHIGIALVAFYYCYRWPLPRGLARTSSGLWHSRPSRLPWPLYVMRHIPHAVDLWRYESVGELSDNVENARPFWFYGPNIVFITLPWAIAWVAGFIIPLARPKIRRQRLFPMIWLAATVIFFSFVHLKKNPYLLPAAPAQTLVIVEGLAAALAVARRATGWTWGGAILAGQSAIGIGGFIFVLATLHVVALGAHPVWLVNIAAVAVCCWCLVVLQFRNPMAWVWWQTGGYVLLALGVMLGVRTAIDNSRSAKSVCAELEKRAAAPDTAILRSRLPEEVAVYLPLREQPALARHLLVVVDDQLGAHERSKTHAPVPVPRPEYYEGNFPDGRVLFVDRVPMESAPGDSRWKVFELTVERLRYAAQ